MWWHIIGLCRQNFISLEVSHSKITVHYVLVWCIMRVHTTCVAFPHWDEPPHVGNEVQRFASFYVFYIHNNISIDPDDVSKARWKTTHVVLPGACSERCDPWCYSGSGGKQDEGCTRLQDCTESGVRPLYEVCGHVSHHTQHLWCKWLRQSQDMSRAIICFRIQKAVWTNPPEW